MLIINNQYFKKKKEIKLLILEIYVIKKFVKKKLITKN